MKGVTSVTVSVPLTIRRRGGRKQIIGPDGAVARPGECGAGVVPVNGDPALIKALARGFLESPGSRITALRKSVSGGRSRRRTSLGL